MNSSEISFRPAEHNEPSPALPAPDAASDAPSAEERRRAFPIHPLLIAAFPVLSLYSHNMNDVRLQEVWRPLGFAVAGTIVLWILLTALTRNVRKAALASSLLVLAFFSYGHLSNLFGPTQQDLRVIVVFWCALCLFALEGIIVAKRGHLRIATSVSNLTAIALIAPSALALGQAVVRYGFSDETERLLSRSTARTHSAASKPKPLTPSETGKLQDIYYIVLDAYARDDSLKTFYGYDNGPFVRALEERGFYIARRSRSNYDQTGYSLPASLNMRYLGDLPHTVGPSGNLSEVLRRMIDENAVAAYLRQRGYHYVYIWTGTAQTRVETADLVLDDRSLPPPETFERRLLSLTALDFAPAMRDGAYERHRAYIQSGFANLKAATHLPYPKFVVAHISAPHPPFVFGSQGEPIDPMRSYTEDDGSQLLHWITRDQYRAGYVAQLHYINRLVLDTIDTIRRESRREPMIILQSDHGSRMNLDFGSLERTDLREPYSILNAYLVTAAVRRNLYQNISPVNSFRVLLASVFGAKYKTLPDRSFYSTAARPLDWVDVTQRIPEQRFVRDAALERSFDNRQ